VSARGAARHVFTVEERERLRESLVAAARSDARIVGAAHTGSAALGREDRWSDIDLALSVATGAVMDDVVADWTRRLYEQHGAVAHHDIWYGATRFRVFLLADTLQVDLAFWHDGEFGAIGPTFRLIFGTTTKPPPATLAPPATPRDFVGMAWLYALHVRSSLARGRAGQAEPMLSGMRDHVLALVCARHGLSAQGLGMEDLPREIAEPVAASLVRTTEAAELARAFAVLVGLLSREVEHVDASLARRLTPTLAALAV
jgi:predicted nucleotidyltransferase